MITQHSFSPPHSRIWDKAKILVEKGYEVSFIGVDYIGILPSKEKLEYGDVLRIPHRGIYSVSIPILGHVAPFLENPFKVLKMQIVSLKINADIYHVFGLSSILIGAFLKIFGKKLIYEIGDDDPGYNTYPLTIQMLMRALEGLLMKFYDVIITVTDQWKEERLRYHSNIITLHYCPHPNFKPDNSMISKNAPNIIVYVGQITLKKGILELLESLLLVIKKMNNVKLLIIGDFSFDADTRLIKKYIANRHLQDKIEITGWLPHIKIPKLINIGKIGLVISQPWCYSYVTSIPNKLIEYMACAKPVIASNGLFEVRKIIQREKCGVLVDNKNVNEIADAIIYLLKHDDIREQMGQRSRRYIEKRRNWMKFHDDLLNIYFSLSK